MIKAEQIPKSVVNAAFKAYWHEKPNASLADAIAGAINAWPNGGLHVPVGVGEPRKSFTLPAFILPLQENPNAEG